MSDTVAGANQPTLDASIVLACQFSAVDDKPPKREQKRNDPAKGKDGQLKIGDWTQDQEVIVPLTRFQWAKKREHGQIRLLDEDEVKDKMREVRRSALGAAKIRIIVWRDAVGQYRILFG